MLPSFTECSDTIRDLDQQVRALEQASTLLQLPSLAGREWYELLRNKLVPQLGDSAFLVAAVVGGTNIGKSVVFNHLAGISASAVSPLASGTKHPVCLVPERFTSEHDLEAIFDGFQLSEWTDASEELVESEQHRLFWKTDESLPNNLLVLDTPDIDSDAEVNWERAKHVRRAADILIAVLTQQKYNDAAVKQFFRQAAEEQKAIMVVFNQCQLPDDEAYWPIWLDTFCSETGVQPESVYLAPNDRRAAEENRLTFFRCPSDHSEPIDTSHDAACDLMDELSRLRFAEIKLQTLRGSLQTLLDSNQGVPVYLKQIRQRSREFQQAAERLTSESVAKVEDWPVVPNPLLITEVRRWWKSQHDGMARTVHNFYDAIGNGVMWPIRFAKKQLQPHEVDPFGQYREREWAYVLRAVENIYEKISWMSESGSSLLQPHFERIMTGRSRAELLQLLRDRHELVDLQFALTNVVDEEMQAFQTNSPQLYQFYRQINKISAAVRPATSVVLFTMGWGPAGEVVAPFVAEAATQAVIPIVADMTGGTAAAIAGETAVSNAAGQGAGFLHAKFQRLQVAFTATRVSWLLDILRDQLLGTLPEDLSQAANVPQTEAFVEVERLVSRLEQQSELLSAEISI